MGRRKSNFNIMDIALDFPTGYILDLKYPQHLHDAHTYRSVRRAIPESGRKNKFLATLYDKKHYVIHYRNLQQYFFTSAM